MCDLESGEGEGSWREEEGERICTLYSIFDVS